MTLKFLLLLVGGTRFHLEAMAMNVATEASLISRQRQRTIVFRELRLGMNGQEFALRRDNRKGCAGHGISRGNLFGAIVNVMKRSSTGAHRPAVFAPELVSKKWGCPLLEPLYWPSEAHLRLISMPSMIRPVELGTHPRRRKRAQ